MGRIRGVPRMVRRSTAPNRYPAPDPGRAVLMAACTAAPPTCIGTPSLATMRVAAVAAAAAGTRLGRPPCSWHGFGARRPPPSALAAAAAAPATGASAGTATGTTAVVVAAAAAIFLDTCSAAVNAGERCVDKNTLPSTPTREGDTHLDRRTRAAGIARFVPFEHNLIVCQCQLTTTAGGRTACAAAAAAAPLRRPPCSVHGKAWVQLEVEWRLDVRRFGRPPVQPKLPCRAAHSHQLLHALQLPHEEDAARPVGRLAACHPCRGVRDDDFRFRQDLFWPPG